MPQRAPSGYELYTRPDSGFWWVRYYVGTSRKRTSTGVVNEERNRGEAAAEAARIVFGAHNRRGVSAPVLPQAVVDQLNIAVLFGDWLDEIAREARAHGRNVRFAKRLETDFRYICRRFKHPREITAEAWESWKLDLHKSNGGPLGWRSIAHLANTVRHFLRWCKKKNAISDVPELKSPTAKQQKSERAKKSAMTTEQREAFLWALALLGEARALRVYIVLYQTWLRKRPVQHIARSWIDREAETLTIPPAYMKNREQAVIDLTPLALEALDAEAAAQNADRKEAGKPPLGDDDPIIGYFDYHWTNKKEHPGMGVFDRALALAGIPRKGLTPHHGTRHTSASIAASQPDATLSGIMKQGAWASAQIVEQTYMHPELADARRITRRRN